MGREARLNAAKKNQVAMGGGYFMLDVEKLTRDEHLIIGEINACERWAKAFDEMRLQSADMIERQFLSEIVRCLRNDAESMGTQLAKTCKEKGMGSLVESAPSTETPQ
jgi:hypothetical protein